tara:strand:- start:12 stop:275 length:264 start_codon:yes stop_codon:yes gene_type:complete
LDELEKKILWQCRRGLWELDAILIPFVEKHLSKLTDEEINKFQQFLSYEDIEIFDILVNKKQFEESNLIPIVTKIIDFHNDSLEQGN